MNLEGKGSVRLHLHLRNFAGAHNNDRDFLIDVIHKPISSIPMLLYYEALGPSEVH